ncbi:chaplin [Streptomyces bluensis]|uniref:chaplin n=1 Tax=Streptomyces bluensis TaxID=33897 RepID=UPI003319FD7E
MRQTLSKGMVAAAAATGILSLYNTSALADSSAQGTAEGSAGVLSGNSVQAPVHIPINVCGNTVGIIGVGSAAFGNSCAHESKASTSGGASRNADSEREERKGARGPESLARPASQGSTSKSGGSQERGASEKRTTADTDKSSGASAKALASPGTGSIGSGNVIQAPVELPVNVCGNTADVLALLNGAFGGKCATDAPPKDQANPPEDYPDSPDAPETPDAPDTDKPRHQPPATSRVTPPKAPTTSVGKPSVTPSAMAETGTEGVLAASAASAVLIAGGALLYRRSRTASRR